MIRISAIVAVGAMTLLLGLPAGTAAQMPDTRDRTIMTFSAPVELPVYGRMGLQPGVLLDDSAELLNLMAPPRRAASRR